MRKNLRLFSIVMACLLIFAAFAGCSAKPTTSSSPATIAATGSTSTPIPASKYPEKPITFVVPMSAGGGSDIFCRTLVKIINDKKLSPVPIVVENKPGASGAIGWSYVANDRKGDPYTISTTSASFYTNPLAGQSPVSYKNFTHIMNMGSEARVFVVAGNSKYNTLKDFTDDAKANPGKLVVGGSSGVSQDAILFYGLKQQSGIDAKYVPFSSDGTDPTTTLMGGHITAAWLGPAEITQQLDSKKLKALAVSGDSRMTASNLKDVRTTKEEGYDLNLDQLRGIVAPPGIPEDAVKYLQDMFKKVSETEEWKTFLNQTGCKNKYATGKDFEKLSVETNDMIAKYMTLIPK
ncbi:MAG: hypothetical protein K0R31_2287 [Clostridiales bacterium]|nr:hypothetical protein [Clostridiales bacterium]